MFALISKKKISNIVNKPKSFCHINEHHFKKKSYIIAPKLVNVILENGKIINGCDIYIGNYKGIKGGFYVMRSKWQNPYYKSQHSPKKKLLLYKNYIMNHKFLMIELKKLNNKNIGCICDNPRFIKCQNCHGQVIVDLFKEKFVK